MENAMKKILFIMLLGVLLISLVSAGLDSSKEYDKSTQKIMVLDKSSNFEAQYQLLSNQCDKQFRFCNATIQTTLYKDSKLLDSINFFKLDGLLGKVRSYSIYYYTKGEKVDVNDYGYVCFDSKGNEIKQYNLSVDNCSYNIISTHKEDAPEWTLYEGQTFKKNDVKLWLIKAEKKPSWSIDWVVSVLNGTILNEWAIWGNISLGDTAEVILNSPANNSVNIAGMVLFNASANVTNGANITNMSLWTNQSGVWNRVNISNYSTSNSLIFNDTTETAYGTGTRSYDNPDAFIDYIKVDDKALSSDWGPTTAIFNYLVGDPYTTPGQQPGYLIWNTRTFTNPNKSLIVTSVDVHYGGTSNPDVAIKNFEAWGYTYPNNWTTTFNQVIDKHAVWNVEACDTDGVCGFAPKNWTIKYDLINITVISPSSSVSSANIIINATFNASGTMTNCSYNITRGASTEKVTTFLNCSQFNDTYTLSGEATYSINFFGNTTTGIARNYNYTFTYATTPVSPGGGGGGGGTIIEKLQEEPNVNFCLEKKTEATFKTAWKNFMNALTWTNFKLMWFALWNHSNCLSSASLVPLTGV